MVKVYQIGYIERNGAITHTSTILHNKDLADKVCNRLNSDEPDKWVVTEQTVIGG